MQTKMRSAKVQVLVQVSAVAFQQPGAETQLGKCFQE